HVVMSDAFVLAPAVHTERWHSGYRARAGRYLRTAQRIPIRRRSHRTTGTRRAPAGVRTTQEKTSRRRAFRDIPETHATALPFPHRHCTFTQTRSNSRFHRNSF